MSCSLLSLYPSILVPILFEWSTDEDLCYLDTAVCSKTHREGVLRLMRKGKLVNTNTDRERSAVEMWISLRLSNHRMASRHFEFDRIELKGCFDVNESVLDDIVHSGVAPDYMRLTGLVAKMRETLKMYGHFITNLWCGDWYDFPGEELAKLCPNLKELTFSRDEKSMYSIVNQCCLDFIGHCNIAALKGSTDSWNYYCDLQRTTDCTDETAVVCLGDDKYYHMTALYCRGLSDEDRSTLKPLLSHVKSAHMFRDKRNNMWLAENCHNLTYLHVLLNSDHQNEIVMALQRCKQLKTLWLDNHCIKLWFSDEVVNAVFVAVFQCTSLQFIKLNDNIHFTQYIATWFDDVVGSAVFLKISCSFATRVIKKVRGIEICYHTIDIGVIHQLLVRCSNLTRIVFDNVSELNDTLLNEHRCPSLTSLSLVKCRSLTDGGIASALSWCTNLHLLALVDVKLSNATLTDLLHRNRLLRYLDVEKCQQISDEVMSSIKSCPLLRYLNVKGTAVTDVGYNEWRSSARVSSLTLIRPTRYRVSEYCGMFFLEDFQPLVC